MSAVPSHPGPSSSAQSTVEELVAASTPAVAAAAAAADDDDASSASDADPPAEGSSSTAAGPAAEGDKKRKKKKKSKAKKAVNALKAAMPGSNTIPDAVLDRVMHEVDKLPESVDKDQLNEDEVRKGLQAMKLMDFLRSGATDTVALEANAAAASGAAGRPGKKDLGEHKFWKTQPVVQARDAASSLPDGPIDPPRAQADIRATPYALPGDFMWDTIDVEDPAKVKELYELLTYNYVEDQEATMRFAYSAEFLDWALKPPGYVRDWQVGVRVKSTGKLVAFISGIPVALRARTNTLSASEINFLVVHKKLRSKRLAPVLIKEVTRRCNLHGVFQAVYTAGVVLPTPVAVARYYHRNLNPPKLVDIGFAYVPRGQTLARYSRSLALPEKALTPGWREMERRDLDQVTDLLGRYLKRFDIAPEYAADEVEHWLLSGRGKGDKGADGADKGRRTDQVTWVYVVEDPETGRVTDVASFYSLPSSVLNSAKHPVLHAAYTFYYATESAFASADGGASGSSSSVGETDEKVKERKDARLRAIMKDLLIEAKAAGFDVMNSLTMLDNNAFLADQKFGPGDGYLNYYLYNWRTANVSGGFPDDRSGSSAVGLVML